MVQAFADCFSKRWLREYLLTLIARHKWTVAKAPLEKGDVVLVVDMNTPRNIWKRGTVIEAHPHADGQVRVERVKIPLRQVAATDRSPYWVNSRKLVVNR